MESKPALLVEYAVAARALPGELVSGDKHLVKSFADGVLVAVIDGLGHGAEAAKAAAAAAAILDAYAHEDVVPLLERCHRALKPTRGVAMSLASFNHMARTMTWGGIGNVEGALVRRSAARRSRESLLTRSGIVGYQLTTTTASVLPINSGDTLALATDGIEIGFASEVTLDEAPQRIADRILDRYAKGNDDALVLIARWTGPDS